jgi:hypothetical protein
MSALAWRNEVDAQMTRGLEPAAAHAPETPTDVFRALLERYRQAGQDHISVTWGESWPTHTEREAEAVRELPRERARWTARFAAAAQRGAPG